MTADFCSWVLDKVGKTLTTIDYSTKLTKSKIYGWPSKIIKGIRGKSENPKKCAPNNKNVKADKIPSAEKKTGGSQKITSSAYQTFLPPISADTKPSDWTTANESYLSVLKYGKYVSEDKKIIAMRHSFAYNDPLIDIEKYLNILGHLMNAPALALYGHIGEDGRFEGTGDYGQNEAVALIIISEYFLEDRPDLVREYYMHELRHAEDLLSGKGEMIFDRTKRIVDISDIPEENSEETALLYAYLAGEIRAHFSSLSYFIAHQDMLERTYAEKNIKRLVNDINWIYGYKNYLLEQNSVKIGGSEETFSWAINQIFEYAVPEETIDGFNTKLVPYKLKIDINTKNTEEKNLKAEKVFEHSKH